jgi:hypothetical protein
MNNTHKEHIIFYVYTQKMYSGSTLHKLRGHNLRYSSLYVNISGRIMKYTGDTLHIHAQTC